MKKIIFFILFSIFVANINAYENRNLLQGKATKEQLKEFLITNQSWNPFPAYTDRTAWEKLIGDQKDYYIQMGEKYTTYNWQVVTATDYLAFNRTGERMTMQKKHDDNLTAISYLFLAELAEGKGRFLDPLANGVYFICEMTSWSIAAHQVVQKAKGSLPAKEDYVIDLVSSDVGAAMSWIYNILGKELGEKVSPLIPTRLENEITERILKPALSNTYWWMAKSVSENSGSVNNWNPWCNTNVLQCFLLVEKNKDTMVDGVYSTMQSVDKFINYVKEDGACEEGPSYWGHAGGKMYDYLELLYEATDGKVNVFDNPMVKNMGEYIVNTYIGNQWVVNFADASAKASFDYRVVYRYGDRVGSQPMKSFAKYIDVNFYEKSETQRDMFRILSDLSTDQLLKTATPALGNNPFVWYPQTEFCYMRVGDVFLATKGGYNNESHNHNDIGTFSLYYKNTPFFIDAGVGTYTAKTFSTERYSIWTMQSDYHNLPQINGYSQLFGKQYTSKNAKVNKGSKSFSIDLGNAYPADAGINSWLMDYKVGKDKMEIKETFDLKEAKTANQLNFLTWGNVDITKEGEVTVVVDGKTATLQYDYKEFTASMKAITLDDTRLSNVWGSEIYRVSLTAKNITNKGTYNLTIKFNKL